MFDGPFALALTAGMIATVNPCGFALLPAYLAAFVGMADEPQRAGRLGAVGRALAVSLVLTAGFVTVFGVLGALFGAILDQVQPHAPWFTIVLGVVLVGLGVALLRGRQLNLALPKLQRGGSDGTLASMYLYGVSYAVASLSCGITAFLAVTSSASSADSYFERVLRFVVYGFGMGLVITTLTVAVALARSGVVARLRRALPTINRIAGALMIIAGAYVAYYGWYELRLLNFGGSVDDPIVDAAIDIQSWLQRRFPNVGNYGWYVAGAVGAIGMAVVYALRGSRSGTPAAD